MEVDFVSNTDAKFLEDNLFSGEDLDPGMFDELPDFDLEANLGTEDIFSSLYGLNTDFHLPLLDDSSPHLNHNEEAWMNNDDSSSDSGISGSSFSIKQEPLSPASSNCSETEQFIQQTCSERLKSNVNIQYPLTPPRDAQDPPSPTMFLQGTGGTQQVVQVKQEALPKPVLDVLNKKTKIQPKPVTVVNGVTAAKPAASKPLVLSAQEFAKLTAQGVLRFNPPVKDVKPGTPTVPQVTPQSEAQSKAVKRQQRMIKNRESACLSRKKRKEYMSLLEEKLQQCAHENSKLKEENETLRRKLQCVQNENESLRKTFNGPQAAKVTCLLSIVLLLGLNLTSFSITQTVPEQPSLVIPKSLSHHSRSLMSFDENENLLNSSHVESALRGFRQMKNDSRDLMLVHDMDSALCPVYFNKTESQRLANELTGWVLGHKKEHIKKQIRKEVEKAKITKKAKRKAKVKKRNYLKILNKEDRAIGQENTYPMQLFTGYDQSYYDFLHSINRRNDTFYVVSFERDHLLLPATAHNKTMRPRMSLVMPALNLNATMQPPVGSIAMMQIDCEVMDTRLLYLKKSVVPSFLRENQTQTVMPSLNP